MDRITRIRSTSSGSTDLTSASAGISTPGRFLGWPPACRFRNGPGSPRSRPGNPHRRHHPYGPNAVWREASVIGMVSTVVAFSSFGSTGRSRSHWPGMVLLTKLRNCAYFLRRVLEFLRPAEDHHRTVVDVVIIGRARHHQPIVQAHGQADILAFRRSPACGWRRSRARRSGRHRAIAGSA